MFDLEKSITNWCQGLDNNRMYLPEDVHELESHLRDTIEGLKQTGMSDREAFEEAMVRMGNEVLLENEYRKVRWVRGKRLKHFWRDLQWEATMLGYYLKLTLRQFNKQKLYALTNFLGLTLAFTGTLLIFLYVYDEFNYDQFHEKADRIVRVTYHYEQNGIKATDWRTPPETASLFSEIPEVETVVQYGKSNPVVRYKEYLFREPGAIHASENFFNVFSHPFLAGNPETALQNKYSIVITRSVAEKYFGNEPALGKNLIINQSTYVSFEEIEAYKDQPFIVTGIIEDVPPNASFNFDMILSQRSMEGHFPPQSYRPTGTFLLLREGESLETVYAKVPALFRTYFGDQPERMKYGAESLVLQPITSIHLSPPLGNEWIPGGTGGNIQYLLILITLGIFLLLIASVNYVNLSTARTAGRAREIGVQKVMGALRIHLARKQLIESMSTTMAALLLALIVSYLCLPSLNFYTAKAIGFGYMAQWPVFLWIVGVTLAQGILAGLYPALYLTGFSPVDAMRRTVESGLRGRRFRGALVVLQFALSVALIAFAVLVFQQLQFIHQKNPGFEKKSVVIVDNINQLVNQQDVFLEEVRQLSQVERAGISLGFPGRRWGIWQIPVYDRLADIPEQGQEASSSFYNMYVYPVDDQFVPAMGIELAAGRNFNRSRTTDEYAVLVNEAAVQAYGWEDPIGKHLYRPGPIEFRIVGVVKDFHFLPYQEKIGPLIIMPTYEGVPCAVIKMHPEATRATLMEIETIWKKLQPEEPFTPFFLDEQFESTYRRDIHFGVLVGVFTALSILIACLGMLGLAAFTAERRTKEIGIRKALGASVSDILILLNRETVLWVGLASVIGLPIGFLAIQRWLENFAYRVEVSLIVFVLAAVFALAIALLTVSYQSLKGARTNPVETLRYE